MRTGGRKGRGSCRVMHAPTAWRWLSTNRSVGRIRLGGFLTVLPWRQTGPLEEMPCVSELEPRPPSYNIAASTTNLQRSLPKESAYRPWYQIAVQANPPYSSKQSTAFYLSPSTALSNNSSAPPPPSNSHHA